MTRLRVRIVTGGGPGSELTPFFAGSLAAHVLLAVGLILMPSLRGSSTIASQPIFVELAAAAVAQPRVEPPKRPPEVQPVLEPAEPEPQPEPEHASVVDKLPEPDERPKPRPPEPKPARPAPEREPTPSNSTPAPGEAANGPSGPSVAGDFGGVEHSWYRDQVGAALRSHWRPPILSRVRQTLSVSVFLEILRDGSVRNPQIVNSSGIPSLDRSALRAVIEAQPLPPLPNDWSRSTMSGTVTFHWTPEY